MLLLTMKFSMMPMMSSMTLDFVRDENNSSNAVTARAPAKAATTSENWMPTSDAPAGNTPPNASMMMATPNPAPELMPKMSGPANGLLKAV